MTHERDLQPLLDEWFADGPDRAPDRVLDVVIDRLERQGQRQAWRLQRRLPSMNTTLKTAAAIAAVVVLAVIGYNLLPASSSQVGGPGPTATSSPSPTPVPPALPDGRLEARDYVARVAPGDSMAFTITAPQGWTGLGGFFIAGPNLSDAPAGVGIAFSRDPEVVTDPCDSSTHTPAPDSTGPTVADLAAALSARTDLGVSGVTDTTLAGYPGKRLDLQFPTNLRCDNYYVFAEPKGLYANGPANRWRVWLLDVGGDTAVVVLLDYAGTPEADRTTAQAAIDSIRITP